MQADPLASSLPEGPKWLIMRLALPSPTLAQLATLRLVSYSWHAWIMHPNHYGHDFQAVLDHGPKRKDISPAGPVRDLTIPVLSHRLVTDISLDCSRLSDHGLQILSEKIAQNLRTITLRNCSGDNITVVGLLAITKKLSLETTSFTIGECPWLSATDAGRLQRAYPMIGCRPIFINCPNQHRPSLSDQELLRSLDTPRIRPVRASDLFRRTARIAPPAHPLVHPLTHLDLSGRLSLSNRQLGTIIGTLPKDIVELNFSQTLISDAEISLLSRLSNLRILKLNDCANLTSDAVKQLAHWIQFEDEVEAAVDYQMDNCPNVQSLDLSGCRALSDTQLARLIEILHPCDMTSASLLNCRTLTKGSLSLLAERYDSLEQIDLTGCSFRIKASDLFDLLPVSRAILPNGELVIRDSTTDPLLAQILEQRQGASTRCLDLTNCAQLTDASLPLITSPELTSLRLAGCKGFSPDGFSSLGQRELPHLTELDLSQCAIGEESRWMPRGLKRLKLCNTPLTFSSRQQLQRWVASLPKGLEGLDLVGAGVTSDLLLALSGAGLPLSHLDLRDNPDIDDESLAELIGAYGPYLETLDLTGCDGISERGLDLLRFSMPPRLTHFGLGIQRLDSRTLISLIPSFPPTLASLNLDGSRIGDRALRSLSSAKLPKLRHLSLNGCTHVSGLGVESLFSQIGHRLARLELRGTSIRHLGFATLPEEALANMGSICLPEDPMTIDYLVIETSQVGQDQASLDDYLASLPGTIKKLEIRGPHLTESQAKILAPKLSRAESLILRRLNGLSAQGWQSIFTALTERSTDLITLDLSSRSELTDDELIAIARQAPHLRTLDISRCKHISNKALFALAKYCPNVESLSVESCPKLTDASLQAIATTCTKLTDLNVSCCEFSERAPQFTLQRCFGLRSLDLSGSENVTDTLLAMLPKNLTHLNLQESTPFTGEGIRALAQQCSHLESLNLTYCWEVSQDALDSLLQGCSRLTTLRLAEVGGVGNTTLQALAHHGPNLTTLDLSDCSFSEASLQALVQHCPHLVELRLSGVNLTDNAVRAIGRYCSQLETLDLSNWDALTDDSIAFLAAHCHQLRDLDLKRCGPLTDRSVQALATQCPCLKRLNLSSLSQLTQGTLDALSEHCHDLRDLILIDCEIPHAGLVSLVERLPSLQRLQLTSLDLSANPEILDHEIIAFAQRLHGLQAVNLSGCDRVTEDSITALYGHSPNLRTLDLSGCSQVHISRALALCLQGLSTLNLSCCPITDEALSAIGAHCCVLSAVDLSHCDDVTDAGILALATGCPHLQRLNLAFCKRITNDEALIAIGAHCCVLSAVDLSHCNGVTDAGILALATGCPHLQRLNLAFCNRITNEAIAVIAEQCPKLSHLNVGGCDKLTAPALESIASHCANLESLSLYAYREMIEGREILALAEGCPKLTSWNLSSLSLDMTDHEWLTFARARPQLLSLNLNCNSCSEDALIAIAQNCRQLRHLDLGEHEELTDRAIFAFAQEGSQLSSLKLSQCSGLTDSSLIPLAQACTQLTIFDLSYCRGITGNSILALAQNCSNLADLNLSHCDNVSSPSITVLAQSCHRLKVLNLSGTLSRPPRYAPPRDPSQYIRAALFPTVFNAAPPVVHDVAAEAAETTQAIRAIAANCPELTDLDLSDCRGVTDAEIITLAESCPQLTRLNLGSCREVTEAVILALTTHCRGLATLNLVSTSCAYSARLAHVSDSPLTDLDLAYCQGVTDQVLIALAPRFPRLRHLRLTGCLQLTEGTISRLQSLFPKLKSLTLPKLRGDR